MLRLLLALLTTVVAVPLLAAGPPSSQTVTSRKGVVVCVSPIAADIGADVLRAGGTAVDAAVAVGFAQAVTWPEAGNVGGGGFMLVRPADGKDPVVVEYREEAPAKATVDMFAEDANPLTLKAAGVPGTVRGLALAHSKFGKRPWKALVLPAARLATDGFPVNAALAASLNGVLGDPDTTNPEFRRVYGKPVGGPWKAGDMLTLPDLGRTLKAIAETGPDSFYTGKASEQLVAEMKAGGGLIAAADLAGYKVKVRPPVRGTYRGYDVLSVSPPSGGGIVLVEALNILETFDLSAKPRYSTRTVHLMAEAMRRAYADRARYLGDPDVTPIPDFLTSKAHARELAAGIDPAKVTPSAAIAKDIPLAEAGGETTHYSIVDATGMCVANTYTLERSYGNRIVVRGAGYILNNEMTDFNHIPGRTDRLGRVGTPPNLVAPGKRMLSSQCPTILVKDGKPVLVTGSPGGRTIPNTVLGIVVNVVDYGMSVGNAVAAPRVHHQWFPDRIDHEKFDGFPDLAAGLTKMGHTVRSRGQGDGHSISIDPTTGTRTGAADKRRDGKAAAQ